MDKIEPRWNKDEQGIHIDVGIRPEINIPVEFDLTDDEYNQQVDALVDWRSTRIQREITLHLSERKSLRAIANIVGVSKSQVFNDIEGYKKEALKSIVRDVRVNKSALGKLVELVTQVDDRIRLYWAKYNELERSSQVLGVLLDRTYSRLQKNPKTKINNGGALKDIAREKRAIAESQKNILAQLRAETQQLLNTYDAFGLTSPEAVILAGAGEGYIQKKMDDIRSYIRELVEIIKFEVPDERQRRNIFGRLAIFVKEKDLSDEKSLNNGEADNEYRI